MRAGLTVLVWLLVLMLAVPMVLAVLAVAYPAFSRAAGPQVPTVYTVDGQYGFGLPDPASAPRVAVAILPAMVVGIVGILLVLGVLSVLLRRRRMGYCGRRGDDLEVDEARMMQEIYRSLGRMEQRIEALETLLLDRPAQPGAIRPESRHGIGRGV